MSFDFNRCRDLLLQAVIDSFRQRSDFIKSIERTVQGDLAVNGLALEVYPWHEQIAISLRLWSDPSEVRYKPADWPHYAFVISSEHDFAALHEANRYVSNAYKAAENAK